MRERMHWTERCDYVSGGDLRILGEDDDGALFVPSKTRQRYWDRPFRATNPTHWLYWLRSRRQLRIVALEWEPAEGWPEEGSER